MSSELAVVNEALVRLGVPPLASFSDQSAQALTAENVYSTIRAETLSSHPWWFATREVPLAKLSLTPSQLRLTGYTYVYQIPAGVVRVLGLRSLDMYALAGDQLYTEDKEARLVAVFDVEESTWPPYFREAVVFATAAAFAVSITDNTTRAALFYDQAERARRTARSVNAQQTPYMILDLMRIYTRRSSNPLAQA
jgi:hypothetical protein